MSGFAIAAYLVALAIGLIGAWFVLRALFRIDLPDWRSATEGILGIVVFLLGMWVALNVPPMFDSEFSGKTESLVTIFCQTATCYNLTVTR